MPENSIETRENRDDKDTSKSLNGQENNVDPSGCPVFKGGKDEFQEDTSEREEEKKEPTSAKEEMLDPHSSHKSNAHQTNGDQFHDR